MKHAETLAGWMAAMAQSQGLVCEPSSDGCYRIELENDVMIVVEADDNQAVFHLWSSMLDCREYENRRDFFLQQALQLNAYRNLLNGATLAWNETSDHLVLCRAFPVEGLARDVFIQQFVAFCEVCQWLATMGNGGDGDNPAAASPGPFSAVNFGLRV